jgi:septum formation protein
MKSSENDMKLILASKSPRRRYLLSQAGLLFSVIPSQVDESSISVSSPALYAKELAVAKAVDVAQHHPDSWVIGADTIVLIDGFILGKPDSRDHAVEMLGRLSGQTHQVITGYCIYRQSPGKRIADSVKTDVTFKTLSDREIEWYTQTSEPFDKAGAYAIQGLGTFLVKSINGSYSNVVGLPVCEVIEHLIREGVVGFDNAGNRNGATCESI